MKAGCYVDLAEVMPMLCSRGLVKSAYCNKNNWVSSSKGFHSHPKHWCFVPLKAYFHSHFNPETPRILESNYCSVHPMMRHFMWLVAFSGCSFGILQKHPCRGGAVPSTIPALPDSTVALLRPQGIESGYEKTWSPLPTASLWRIQTQDLQLPEMVKNYLMDCGKRVTGKGRKKESCAWPQLWNSSCRDSPQQPGILKRSHFLPDSISTFHIFNLSRLNRHEVESAGHVFRGKPQPYSSVFHQGQQKVIPLCADLPVPSGSLILQSPCLYMKRSHKYIEHVGWPGETP